MIPPFDEPTFEEPIFEQPDFNEDTLMADSNMFEVILPHSIRQPVFEDDPVMRKLLKLVRLGGQEVDQA